MKLNTIPEADEIIHQPPQEETDRHEKWLAQTVKAVSHLINKRRGDLRDGGNVNFFFPALRDMGYGIQEWRDHYREVADLIKAKGYSVEVIKTGYPPSPVLIITIPMEKK